ncbi:hypothetical protein POPTR_007G077300v4 [Populus trichocarpa]|uniref:Root meristem growth factor 9 n=1 Tax=Populus trichocarpa TaxID=3694 RepID=A0A2K1ZQY0_POPTR|nr:hypothetical protein BDE02_07G074200 [Populus trichocarpa]PNT27670.1 hypothetical protein POPTR_007G077300v4 [Populus trichocarpa]
MAKISRNHLVLVAFFLLCFVSTCARAARTLREASNHGAEKKDQNDMFPSKENGLPDVEELVGMDYTPARKKPPIHN